jgi:GGDEF domain-containing protein
LRKQTLYRYRRKTLTAEINNMVSFGMLISSAWARDFMSSLTLPSTRPAGSILARSGTPAVDRWTAIRELTGWLGLSAKSQARARVCVSSDQKSWDLDQDAMFKIGNEMLCRSSGNHQPLSVVVFDLSDLPELECIFGIQAAMEIIAETAARLQGLAARNGLAVRTGARVFTVLLPGVGYDEALDLIGAALGRPCCIELEASGDEIMLVPEFMVRTVFGRAVSLRETFESLCRDIAQTRLDVERRNKYLKRERESHSRPMKLQGTKARPRNISQLAYPPIPATIPVPMGTR